MQLKTLLEELSSEWKGIVDAVGKLKKDITEEKGAPPCSRESAPRESQSPPIAATTASVPGLTAKTVAAAKPEARAKPETDKAAQCKARTAMPAAEPPVPGLTVSPDLEKKLGELLRLLKESVAARGGGQAVQAIEIPRDMTLEIAREVAGRVRESMLEGQHAVSNHALNASMGQTRPAVSGPKRIPFDDLNAMINQITGQDP